MQRRKEGWTESRGGDLGEKTKIRFVIHCKQRMEKTVKVKAKNDPTVHAPYGRKSLACLLKELPADTWNWVDESTKNKPVSKCAVTPKQ